MAWHLRLLNHAAIFSGVFPFLSSIVKDMPSPNSSLQQYTRSKAIAFKIDENRRKGGGPMRDKIERQDMSEVDDIPRSV
jgi:hypothetical protein